MEELEAAAESGLQPLRYVGAPMPHWHQPLLLLHAVARSKWPQPLLGEAAAAALIAFAGACVSRLEDVPPTFTNDGVCSSLHASMLSLLFQRRDDGLMCYGIANARLPPLSRMC